MNSETTCCSTHELSTSDKVRSPGTADAVVLVVDDEALVCALTAEMLRELGYEVYEANSARYAMDSLRRGLKIDVLVTDIRMPEMSGVELAENVLRVHPSVKVLYVTAYASETHGHRNKRQAIELLPKPFSISELEQAMLRMTRNTH